MGVIQHCSHRLGRAITTEEIQAGNLKNLLSPEDYQVSVDVRLFTSLSEEFLLISLNSPCFFLVPPLWQQTNYVYIQYLHYL